jgi:uroporphyrin-III C-methyltransferase
MADGGWRMAEMNNRPNHQSPITDHRGKVWLVGAGPGDPELLTLKAVRALSESDVVLVDDLVDRRVLAHARPEARIVEVGKRGGCKSTPQAFIEKLMVRLARRGAIVARLKGGDPFIFGRGGEEILALSAAGVPVEIVSGITAGIAAPAALGIPVTHRDVARGVTFLTGHAQDGAEPNWAALRAAGTTLVIYMGVKRVAALVAGMLEAGFPADTPACAIRNGTLETQAEVVTTLAALPAAAMAAQLDSPAILVVGEVVSLARTNVNRMEAAA